MTYLCSQGSGAGCLLLTRSYNEVVSIKLRGTLEKMRVFRRAADSAIRITITHKSRGREWHTRPVERPTPCSSAIEICLSLEAYLKLNAQVKTGRRTHWTNSHRTISRSRHICRGSARMARRTYVADRRGSTWPERGHISSSCS